MDSVLVSCCCKPFLVRFLLITYIGIDLNLTKQHNPFILLRFVSEIKTEARTEGIKYSSLQHTNTLTRNRKPS